MKQEIQKTVPVYAFVDRNKAEYLSHVPEGIWALRLRAPDIDDSIYLEIARQLKMLSKSFSFKLAVDFRPRVISELDYDLVHLRVQDIEEFEKSDVDPGRCFLSAHNTADLRLAKKHHFGYAVLSPVFDPLSPKSDPAVPLGIERFSRMVKKFPELRVFALGGISPERIDEVVSSSGCFGVAGIRLFDALL